MATAPKTASLPLFYKDLIPLNTQEHANYSARSTNKAAWMVGAHAIPLTVEEFPMAQRHYPIVFSTGDDPVPLALMGMNEGVNVFVDDDGTVNTPIYVPAYVRRYPFLLAKLQADKPDLSLCFDPTSELIGEFEDGKPLFADGAPSASCQDTLKFCEHFEQAGARTGQFVAELKKHDLLMDGELNIESGQAGGQPFIYRGFRMVDENKLRDVRGDVLRGWNQSGLLPLIYAHLFSLELVREIFGRQVQLGKVAAPQLAQA
ncbi:SapC family protein [Novosphingobium album (ex Liu et al. 2023)]|uniref:SapC family protein n=1 Tax=Novosphingobium album (ex Liu et al. 2023) TaxID=3031130 RepID=A0ABT5WNH7_9SPHN|nr:SapC family protein [Novosphingobium album (ex Liu et al. 2023)]MDE8651590.1 SapC family protein [Novosphingobium album (ex Liu et al. 2023)]